MEGRDSLQMQKAENTVVEGSLDARMQMDALQQRLTSSQPIQPTVEPSPVKADPVMDKVVDINMVNAPVSDLMSALADQLHLNLIIDPKVLKLSQRSTMNLRRVSARDVLSSIFNVFDIDGTVKDKLLTVNLTTHQTFHIDVLASKSQLNIDDGGDVFGAAGKQAGSSALKGNAQITQEVGGKADPYDDVLKSVESIVTGSNQGGKSDGDSYATLDRVTGTLYVNARPSRVKAVGEFLAHQRAVRARQIQIEAQLIDVQLTDQFNLGVDWNLLTHNLVGRLGSGSTTIESAASLAGRAITIPQETIGNTSGFGNGLAYNGNAFSVALNALRTFGTVRTLSNPLVRLSNGVPAYLSVGTNYRYINKVNSTVNNIGGGSSSMSTDVQTDSLFSGVVIAVSAFVNHDGNIELFVHPMQTTVSPTSLNLVKVGDTGTAVTLPVVSVKGITTTLKLNSGDMVLIGGLISQSTSISNNGLPGVADLPIAGSLFDNVSKSHGNQELVIVLRARVLN